MGSIGHLQRTSQGMLNPIALNLTGPIAKLATLAEMGSAS